jgi:hypothetical protein
MSFASRMHVRDPELAPLVADLAARLDRVHRLPAGAHVAVRPDPQTGFGAPDGQIAIISIQPGCYAIPYLLHEVGHWVDMLLAGSRMYMNTERQLVPRLASDALPDWLAAVQQSEQHASLSRIAAGEGRSAAWARYALQTHELWAMTYTQWALARIGLGELIEGNLHELAAETGLPGTGVWQAEDFAPIAREIERTLAPLALAAA